MTRIEGEGRLLRIFLGEHDRWQGHPLYQAILTLARDRGIAGATVLRGIEGFGAGHHLHTARILSLSESLPIIVEIVDTDENIAGLLPELDEMLSGGMITSERVHVIAYGANSGKAE